MRTRDFSELKKDAHKIVMFDELLEAAKLALERLGERPGTQYESEASRKLRAAIAKAKGAAKNEIK